jgi:hypothetical protein
MGRVPVSASPIPRSVKIDSKIVRAVLSEAEGIRFSTVICPSKAVEYILCSTVVKFTFHKASVDKKLKVQQL